MTCGYVSLESLIKCMAQCAQRTNSVHVEEPQAVVIASDAARTLFGNFALSIAKLSCTPFI